MFADLRYAIRSLFKTPHFTVVAVLVLALGIGANAAMFSVVYNVLLRPLAYPHPDRLMFVQETSLRRGGNNPTAPGTYMDWRDQQHVFESMAAAELWGATLTGTSRPEEVSGLKASTSLFTVLRTTPFLGRSFLPEDEEKEAGHVVVLSHGLWARRFGGDRQIIGQPITLSGASYRVIGVMPADFRFPPFWALKAELWVPLVFPPQRRNDRGGRSLRVFARLRDGVSVERASAEMSTIARRIELAFPASNTDTGARVTPLSEIVSGQIRPALMVLLGAVAFLLLIACANVANLLLGRATARQKEVALRLALGASRWRLVRQLLVESVLLSVTGGVLGVLLANWSIRLLTVSIADASRFTLPRYQEIGMGGVVLLFAFGVSLVTGILFGVVPALQFSRPDLQGTLKDGGRGSRAARTPLRSLLVVGEVAVSLMLLSGAGLMIRSFAKLDAVDAGFDPHNVLTMRVVLTGSQHAATPEKRNAFYRQVLERVSATPGVVAASGINHLPLAGDLWTFSFRVEGRPEPNPADFPKAAFRVVFPDYFRTMAIPVLRGRDVSARDNAGAPNVVVINQSMAQHEWPHDDAIGKRIRLDSNGPWYTVVGVVKDAEQADWGATAGNEFYFSPWQNPEDIQRYLTLVVRTAGDPLAMAAAVQGQIWSLDRDLPIGDAASMQQVVERAVWQPRFSTTLLGGFAALALVLAAIGIYGVMSFDVGQRTQEIGIRMALGAKPGDVLRSVLGGGAKLAGIGTVIGIVGALALTRYLKTLLYEVSTTDPLVLAAAAGILGLVAMASVWLPARRATRVDPMIALRSE